jgi:hypothetical protein
MFPSASPRPRDRGVLPGEGREVTADAWADVIVIAGGLFVLFGSIAQALGDLRKYSDLLDTGKEQIEALTTIARVAAGSGRGLGAVGIAVLPVIALWRGKSVTLTDPALASPTADEESAKAARDLRERAEQALNDAAAWSLILTGSLAALAAALFQFYIQLRH